MSTPALHGFRAGRAAAEHAHTHPDDAGFYDDDLVQSLFAWANGSEDPRRDPRAAREFMRGFGIGWDAECLRLRGIVPEFSADDQALLGTANPMETGT
jgi:hypothetical protein